jgi:hypothetical protein
MLSESMYKNSSNEFRKKALPLMSRRGRSRTFIQPELPVKVIVFGRISSCAMLYIQCRFVPVFLPSIWGQT